LVLGAPSIGALLTQPQESRGLPQEGSGTTAVFGHVLATDPPPQRDEQRFLRDLFGCLAAAAAGVNSALSSRSG